MVVNGGGPQGHPVEGTLEGGISLDGGSMVGGPVPNPLGANKVGIWLGQPPPWGPHDHGSSRVGRTGPCLGDRDTGRLQGHVWEMRVTGRRKGCVLG